MEQSSILIVTGESSGESHAAALMRELKALRPEREFRFFGSGGEAMRKEGVELLIDVRDLAAIGPLAALKQGPHYLRLFRRVLSRCRRQPPELAILVDFPDFNLPLARRLKGLGIPVCYFISPQIWAWRQSRVKQIRRNIDLMLVIFPFEEAFYRERGVEARYVGNPTAARLSREARSERESRSKEIVALLPGSRKKEVQLILPVQLSAAAYMAARRPLKFWVQKAPAIEEGFLEELIGRWSGRNGEDLDLEIRDEGSSRILAAADCAAVKSGTSTLEAMLLEVPFAMVYRLSLLNWLLLRPFVPVRQYCLANWVAGEKIVPEFVQGEATGEAVGRFLLGLLEEPAAGRKIKERLRRASSRLGQQSAAREAALEISNKFFTGG